MRSQLSEDCFASNQSLTLHRTIEMLRASASAIRVHRCLSCAHVHPVIQGIGVFAQSIRPVTFTGGSVMSGAEADAKDVASEQKEPVAADAAGPEVAEESRDSAASLDNDEKSYSGSEEKNGESEDGGEDEEGGHDEEESNEATTEENGKEGENGHVESTDTNGNDRKRVSDVGVGEAAEDGAPALKKKKGEEEEVGAGDAPAGAVAAE
ncbi:hypothetical protein RB195_019426 [Necator americanus]|uniref:Uncharacterized protein n=1 Tax=Necator americanus TaxID=51031 RepID=A0ABR1CGD3_NECAM